MNQTQNMTPHTLLDQATQRLRDAAVAELPCGLLASTAEAVALKVTLPRRTTDARAMAAKAVALVATIAMMVTGFFAFVWSGPAQVAFAQVLNNAKNADSVVFTLIEGGKKHKCMAQGTKCRVEHSSGIVVVSDSKTRKRMLFDPAKKTAGVFDLPEHTVAELGQSLVEQLRQVRPDDAKPMGMDTIDGKTVDLFRVKGIKLFGIDSRDSGKGEMKIWVDPKSMLPWRIELLLGTSLIVTLHEMNWNVPIEPSSLQIQVPEGYVQQPADVFEKRLNPDRATKSSKTPNEAFREWAGQNK